MGEVKTIRLTVYGNALTAIIRDAAERGDIITVLDLFPSGLRVEDIRSIIEGKSEFIGNDVDGFEMRLTDIKTPIDVQKRLDAYVERERREGRNDGFEHACEGIARWLRHEDHDEAAQGVEDQDWFDPGCEDGEEQAS